MKQLPAIRIADLWNWLPAFRVVGETENLREAAEILHITPSALSRTVRLLEEAVEMPLFDRVGRSLKLNANGAALLQWTRLAMREIDEGLRELSAERFRGRVRIASTGLGTEVALPVLTAVRKAHPRLRPMHRGIQVADAVFALTRGQIDIAFIEEPVAAKGLKLDKLFVAHNRVFCGKGHPLYKKRKVTPQDLEEHEFVAPPLLDDGVVLDGWPPELPRKVGAVVDRLDHGRRVCAEGSFLAILPEVFGKAAGLKALPSSGGLELRQRAVYALRRVPLGDNDLAELVARAAHDVVATW